MPKITYEILPDGHNERCDRCKTLEWPRLALHVVQTLSETGEIRFPLKERKVLPPERDVRFVICIMCMAHAIQSITGWNVQGILYRYRDVSPLFGKVDVLPVTHPDTSSKDNPTKQRGPAKSRRSTKDK